MKKHVKDFFIPHAENDYHPHFLHTKRAVFYSAFFFATKIMIVCVALLIPAQVFVSPDVLAEQEQAVIELTNTVRFGHGEDILTESKQLDRSAEKKTQDMFDQEYFGHVGPDQHDLDFFLSHTGYRYQVAGENLAMGFEYPEDIVNAWLASRAHYDNIVDSDFEEVGVHLRGGVYDGQPIILAAMHFGTPERSPSLSAIRYANDVFSGQIYELDPTKRAAIRIDATQSYITVSQEGGSEHLAVYAVIAGDVSSTTVTVGETTLPLVPKIGVPGVYTATAVMSLDAASYGNIPASVVAVGKNGEEVVADIAWKKTVSPKTSWIRTYLRAKTFFANTAIFSWSTYMYVGAAFLFAIALIVNIFVRIHRQHPHIIVQTLSLVFFLVTLALI